MTTTCRNIIIAKEFTSIMQASMRRGFTTRAPSVSTATVPSPLRQTIGHRRGNISCEAASLQFIKGIEEPTIPEVRLSKSRTGASGSALFVFENPSIFQASGEMGDITGVV